ncbi:hypothetical protein DRN44_02200 [Thermococci archaeon]|nr:MAG: hypothetical protein DRN44_02200 [Thermococci archaeon]
MKLREALHKYEEIQKRSKKEMAKLLQEYTKRIEHMILDILKLLQQLNEKEIPKEVDPRLARIVKMERETYVRALQNMLGKIQDIKDVEKILPEISRLHVAHGRHLLLIFEKDVYKINNLLKSLSNEYAKYVSEIEKLQPKEIMAEKLLKEVEDFKKHIHEEEQNLKDLVEMLSELNERKKKLEESSEFIALRENEKELKKEISREELNLRSKVSKLQKPIKRMRLPDNRAREFLKDSGYALEHPHEFLELLEEISDKLDKKYQNTVEWAKKNISTKTQKLKELKRQLTEVEIELSHFKAEEESLHKSIDELKQKINKKEEKIKALKEELQKIEKQLEESLSELEKIIGEKIDY